MAEATVEELLIPNPVVAALGGSHGVASVTFAVSGGTGDAATVSMPSPTVTAVGVNGVAGTATVEIGGFTGSHVSISAFGGAIATATIKAPSVSATGTAGNTGTATLKMPLTGLSAYSGAHGVVDVPRQTVDGDADVPVTATGVVAVPMPRVTTTGGVYQDAIGTLTPTRMLALVSGTAIVGTAATGVLSYPAVFRVAGTGLSGSIGDIDFDMPVPTIDGDGYTVVTGEAELSIPPPFVIGSFYANTHWGSFVLEHTR